jgi:hypothetical protein
LVILAGVVYRFGYAPQDPKDDGQTMEKWISTQDGEVVLTIEPNEKQMKVGDVNPGFDLNRLPADKQAAARAGAVASSKSVTSTVSHPSIGNRKEESMSENPLRNFSHSSYRASSALINRPSTAYSANSITSSGSKSDPSASNTLSSTTLSPQSATSNNLI